MAFYIPRIMNDWELDLLDVADVGDDLLADYLAYINPEQRRSRSDMDYMQIFNAREYSKRYRLTKATVEGIMRKLENDLDTGFIGGLTASEQIHPTLRYFATGTFQIAVGDMSGILHQTSVSRTVRKVSRLIAINYQADCVYMPRTQLEIEDMMQEFYNIARMPYVLCAVDGSHVAILGRGGPHGELYRNRKGYFSLNIQALCDVSLRIRDLITRWFGSCHDSTVLANSRVRADFELARYPGCVLLGDNGYSLKPWLLTPFLKPTSAKERRYNTSHKSTRNVVERCFGVWYRRFPCLSLGIRLRKLEDTQAVIMATACLHNMAITAREEMPDDEADVVQRVAERRRRFPQPDQINRPDQVLQGTRRDQIVQQFF